MSNSLLIKAGLTGINKIMTKSNSVNPALSETIFVNVQRKATKKFDFTIIRNVDGSYLISQQAYRVYPSGHEQIKSSKLWLAEDMQVLLSADFMKNRQGRIFLESIAVH